MYAYLLEEGVIVVKKVRPFQIPPTTLGFLQCEPPGHLSPQPARLGLNAITEIEGRRGRGLQLATPLFLREVGRTEGVEGCARYCGGECCAHYVQEDQEGPSGQGRRLDGGYKGGLGYFGMILGVLECFISGLNY